MKTVNTSKTKPNETKAWFTQPENKLDLLYSCWSPPEARCIKERSSGMCHSCGALVNAMPAPTGALQVFSKHIAPVDLVT